MSKGIGEGKVEELRKRCAHAHKDLKKKVLEREQRKENQSQALRSFMHLSSLNKRKKQKLTFITICTFKLVSEDIMCCNVFFSFFPH